MIEPSGVSFWVPGVALPKGSKSVVRTKAGKYHLVETADMARAGRRSGALRAWMTTVSSVARVHCNQRLSGPLTLEVTFFVPRPKSVKRTRPSVKTGGDIDKLARGVLDALTGIAYDDDSQVIDLRLSKMYADEGEPGVDITILELEP